MLRKAWYAVAHSQDVSDRPVKVTANRSDFVLVRDDVGTVHAFHAYCPHRGCDLSLGSIEQRNLVCPFHGWRFDENGVCTHIPANAEGQKTPPNARLAVYPARDHAGLTWIYTHPDNRGVADAPFISFAELAADDWILVPFEAQWSAHFSRVVESVLDVSHLPFVHPETTGRDVSPVVEGPEYRVTNVGILIHPSPFAPAHPLQPARPPEGLENQTEIELIFPNQWIIRTPMGDDTWMVTFLTFTPLDDETTIIFGIVGRNFDLDSPLLDTFHLDHTEFVMDQDKAIVECIRPKAAPDLRREAHVASDGPTIRYRTMLFEALRRERRE